MMTRKYLALAAASLLAITPALAQESASSSGDAVKEALELETARSNALKARYEAEQAAVAARFAPFEGLAGQGNVERGEGAGEMEGAYLAAMATRTAADLIDRSVQNRAGDRKVLLLVADEVVSLDALTAFAAETRGIRRAFQTVLDTEAGSCSEVQEGDAPGPGLAAAGLPLLPIIGAVANLLQSDTAIQGIGDLRSDRMLALAVSGTRPRAYVRPGALISPDIPPDNEVNTTLLNLDVCRAAAVSAAERLARAQTGRPKARREALQAAIARYDAYLAAITTSGENGSVRLATILSQSLLRTSGNAVLRVYADRGGGTLVTRRNIWTAFGAPAVSTSGGVVVSYSLTEPATGETLASGIYVCNTGLRNIRAAQRLSTVDPQCQPNTPADAASQSARPARQNGGRRVAGESSGSQP